MDLRRFIFHQRLQSTAILALLKGRQSFVVNKMSELVISESTQNESSDNVEVESRYYDRPYRKLIRSND